MCSFQGTDRKSCALNALEVPGSLLLSHAVASIVPSAVWGLTIVFGMETGVSPRRIAAGIFLLPLWQPNNRTTLYL